MSSPFRLAVLTSHPIQYQAPLFRALASQPELDLTVYFCCDHGRDAYLDPGFGVRVKWDVPLLEGYSWEVLPNVAPRPNTSSFFGLINPSIVQQLTKGDYDAVLVYGWARLTNWLAMWTAFFRGIPVFLWADTNALAKTSVLKKCIKQLVIRPLLQGVAVCLAIGQRNRQFYSALGVPKQKIVHAPIAVDNDFFFEQAKALSPKKQELRSKLGLPPQLPIALFSGKLSRAKRPEDLLRAYELVRGDCEAVLVFMGDGSLREDLKAYVRERRIPNVYFAGFQNQSELSRYYAIADVFVVPSGFEPWGLVVNEAMCFGLPIVVSDQVGAAADLVQDGVNGFVYPVGVTSELAKRLRSLLSDEVLRSRMGKMSRQMVADWGIPETVEGVMQALQRSKKGKRRNER